MMKLGWRQAWYLRSRKLAGAGLPQDEKTAPQTSEEKPKAWPPVLATDAKQFQSASSTNVIHMFAKYLPFFRVRRISSGTEMANANPIPGEILQFGFGKLFFLDLALPEHRDFFADLAKEDSPVHDNWQEACRWTLPFAYFTQVRDKIRWAFLLFYQDDWSPVRLQGLMLFSPSAPRVDASKGKENTGKENGAPWINRFIICSRQNEEPEDAHGYRKEVNLGFASWMTAMMTSFVSAQGFRVIRLDAANEPLVPYYAAQGYRLIEAETAASTPNQSIPADTLEAKHRDARDKNTHASFETDEGMLARARVETGFTMRAAIEDAEKWASGARASLAQRFTKYWDWFFDVRFWAGA